LTGKLVDEESTSESTKLPALKSYRKTEQQLAIITCRKSVKKKGSKARRKLAKRESRIHQRIARARIDHAYKTAHTLLRTGKKVFIHVDDWLCQCPKGNRANFIVVIV